MKRFIRRHLLHNFALRNGRNQRVLIAIESRRIVHSLSGPLVRKHDRNLIASSELLGSVDVGAIVVRQMGAGPGGQRIKRR